jgi:multiple antibiotic resistance protein
MTPMEEVQSIAVNALYLLALINPISKVSILTALMREERDPRFLGLTNKSSFVAVCILLGTMIVGDFLLRSVFRVDLYSLRLAGGVVVFWVGLNALRSGIFFENESHAGYEDMVLVPLACPMIAGPATIAACIGLRVNYGLFNATISMLIALGVNHLIMLFSPHIGRILKRLNILGALIRITGLIVMTIGTQMALEGIASWLKAQSL